MAVESKLLETCSDIWGTDEEPATLDFVDSDDTMLEAMDGFRDVPLPDIVLTEVCSGIEALNSADDPAAFVDAGKVDEGPASVELCVAATKDEIEAVRALDRDERLAENISEDFSAEALLRAVGTLYDAACRDCEELAGARVERVERPSNVSDDARTEGMLSTGEILDAIYCDEL